MKTCHGGDIYALERPVLDFSVNLNPLGMPECAVRAAAESAADCGRYPDPQCRLLRRAISHYERVPEECILCGNGASDLIFRLAAACGARRALITAPTFSEYESSLAANNCKVKYHYLKRDQGFAVTPAILDGIRPGTGLVLLCDPNNPTGRMMTPELMGAILSRCRSVGALLAVDQCFLPLACEEADALVAELLGGGLLLIRALTKSYAMPGLRLGYALCADRALLERMAQAGPAWPVSVPAQAAGVAVLEQAPFWPRNALPEIQKERCWLSQQLSGLGYDVCPSQANYILFRAPGDTRLKEKLLRHDILIRSCADYRGLGPDWYRVAVRKHEDNQRLTAALYDLERGVADG